MTAPAFDPRSLLEVLTHHRVRFVIIGGLAARLHGSPSVTGDLDICYAHDTSNLERLAGGLRDLNAHLRGAPADVPFIIDAKTLEAGDHFTLVTDAGALDCFATPAGSRGYEELAANAIEMSFDRLSVLVASIDDLIRLKLAAGRPKDRVEVEILGALRDELEGH